MLEDRGVAYTVSKTCAWAPAVATAVFWTDTWMRHLPALATRLLCAAFALVWAGFGGTAQAQNAPSLGETQAAPAQSD